MARTGVYIGGLEVFSYRGRIADALARVVAIRDAIRAKIDLAAGATTRVGDIFKWQGLNTNYWGHGFQVRHLSSGVLTGHEWTFIFPHYDTTEYLGYTICAANNAVLLNHFANSTYTANALVPTKMVVKYFDNMDLTCRLTASSTSGTIDVGDTLQLQSDATIYGTVESKASATDIRLRQKGKRKLRSGDILEVPSGPNAGSTFTCNGESDARFCDIGYVDHDLMTLAADGDLITGYSPYTSSNNFFPDYTTQTTYHGADMGYNHIANEYDFYDLVYDDVLPAMRVSKTARLCPTFDQIFLSGNLVSQYDTDTSLTAAGLMTFQPGVDTNGRMDWHWFDTKYRSYGGGGGLAKMDLSFDNVFTISNEKNGAGQLLRAPITLKNTNEVKGTIRTDLMFLAGAYKHRIHQTFSFDSKKYQKVSWDFAIMADDLGTPLLPNQRPDLEPHFP